MAQACHEHLGGAWIALCGFARAGTGSNFAGRLCDGDATALRDFDTATRQCLAKLSPETLSLIWSENKGHVVSTAHDDCTVDDLKDVVFGAHKNMPDNVQNEETDHSTRSAQGLRRILDETVKVLKNTRAVLTETDARLLDVQRTSALQLQCAEEMFEEEIESCLQFWRSVAQTSASPQLSKILDFDVIELLGHGKYGFVFKSRRRSSDEPIVVKLLSLRWAHVAAKEWSQAQLAKGCPHIVDYCEALLHVDENHAIQRLLQTCHERGHLSRSLAAYPDKYVCLIEEFMNRGTVQDWLDQDLLLPGGMLKVMRSVASALAHMHQRLLTHNDIKPENVLLSQENEDDPRAEVTVKLADLGLAAKSRDRSQDMWQYGMTVFCMATGEKFGTRKFRLEEAPVFVAEVEDAISYSDGDTATPIRELPRILRGVWGVGEELQMKEVRDWPSLQGWSFFDGELKEVKACEKSRRGTVLPKRLNGGAVLHMSKHSVRRSVANAMFSVTV